MFNVFEKACDVSSADTYVSGTSDIYTRHHLSVTH